MDLEFNIIGFGYTKSCSGINLLHFGTTLVYWASIYHQFLIHSTVYWNDYLDDIHNTKNNNTIGIGIGIGVKILVLIIPEYPYTDALCPPPLSYLWHTLALVTLFYGQKDCLKITYITKLIYSYCQISAETCICASNILFIAFNLSRNRRIWNHTFMALFYYCHHLNMRSHSEQLYGLSPMWWFLLCRFKFLGSEHL